MAACRALDAASCVPLLEGVFRLAGAEGIDVPGDPPIIANLMLGLLNEGALLIAASPEDGALQRRVSSAWRPSSTSSSPDRSLVESGPLFWDDGVRVHK